MIFNNSKKLHRLINCWGPGEGPGGSLGGASADGGMGGTGSPNTPSSFVSVTAMRVMATKVN